jgi:hypothetical protein
MNRIINLFLLLSIWNPFNILAEDFAFLSRNYPVKSQLVAESKTIVDVKFKLNSSKSSRRNLYLRAIYIVGKDTITDYLHFTANFEGLIKQITVEAGEAINVYLYLNNEELEQVKNLSGSIMLISGGILPPNNKINKSIFPGTIWNSDDPILFKISKADETVQRLFVNFAFTENFEFDRLFIRIKVISPEQGILVLNKEIEVNTSDFLEYSKNVIKTEIPDIYIRSSGIYYLQITHQMQNLRVNGLDNVSYELVKQ